MVVFLLTKFQFDFFSLISVIIVIPSIFYCTACYIIAFKRLRQGQGKDHLELLLYPLILIICEFGILLLAFESIFKMKDQTSILVDDIGVLCFLSRGIWNSLAYGLSSKIRSGFNTLCKQRGRPQEKKLLESEFSIITDSDMSCNNQSSRVTSIKAPGFVLISSSLNSQETLRTSSKYRYSSPQRLHELSSLRSTCENSE